VTGVEELGHVPNCCATCTSLLPAMAIIDIGKTMDNISYYINILMLSIRSAVGNSHEEVLAYIKISYLGQLNQRPHICKTRNQDFPFPVYVSSITRWWQVMEKQEGRGRLKLSWVMFTSVLHYTKHRSSSEERKFSEREPCFLPTTEYKRKITFHQYIIRSVVFM
jgi:hypothetical protein